MSDAEERWDEPEAEPIDKEAEQRELEAALRVLVRHARRTPNAFRRATRNSSRVSRLFTASGFSRRVMVVRVVEEGLRDSQRDRRM